MIVTTKQPTTPERHVRVFLKERNNAVQLMVDIDGSQLELGLLGESGTEKRGQGQLHFRRAAAGHPAIVTDEHGYITA